MSLGKQTLSLFLLSSYMFLTSQAFCITFLLANPGPRSQNRLRIFPSVQRKNVLFQTRNVSLAYPVVGHLDYSPCVAVMN